MSKLEFITSNPKTEVEQMNARAMRALEKFDYTAVYHIMQKVGWEWYDVSLGREGYVPSVEKLKATAKDLMMDILKSKKRITECSTGGLTVYKVDKEFFLTFDMKVALDQKEEDEYEDEEEDEDEDE